MGFSRRRVVVGAVILPLVYLLIYVAFSTMQLCFQILEILLWCKKSFSDAKCALEN